MSTIELKNVCKIYKGNGKKNEDKKAVDNFSIKIDEGEFIVFVGPSGCGKSTTLRMIAGLEEISSGELLIDGKYMNDTEPKDRDLAMVFQNYALYPYLTVRDNIAFGLKLRHIKKNIIKEKVASVAKMLDIEDLLDRKPGQLSGGQRQRVALGRAVVRDAKAYLLDEPLSNLDAKLRGTMRVEIINLFKKLQKTFIYVTHDQVEAMTMGTRIVVMNKGIVQQIDTPIEIYDHPKNHFVACFIGTPQMNIFTATILDGKVKITDDIELDINKNNYDLERLKNNQFIININANIENDVNVKIEKENINTNYKNNVLVGIRSEDICLSDEGLTVVVDLIEMLGSEVLIHSHFENTDIKLVIKTPERVNLSNGCKTKVQFKQDKIHLFDKETGETLRR